jgi:hypothetical protein
MVVAFATAFLHETLPICGVVAFLNRIIMAGVMGIDAVPMQPFPNPVAESH